MAQNGQQDEQRLALFIDFENIAIGVRDAHYRKFDVNLVLERLLDKGKLLVKKAYADWHRYSDYKRSLPRGRHRAHRGPAEVRGRQELRGHPAGRGRHGHELPEGAHQLLRGGFGRQRLLAPREQAQGEQQVRDRAGGEELHLRPAHRELRRVHLLRGPRARPAAPAAGDRERPREGGRSASRSWSTPIARPAAREQGGLVGLHGEGDHEAQEALLQRDLLRLPHLLPPARGRAASRHRGPAA